MELFYLLGLMILGLKLSDSSLVTLRVSLRFSVLLENPKVLLYLSKNISDYEERTFLKVPVAPECLALILMIKLGFLDGHSLSIVWWIFIEILNVQSLFWPQVSFLWMKHNNFMFKMQNYETNLIEILSMIVAGRCLLRLLVPCEGLICLGSPESPVVGWNITDERSSSQIFSWHHPWLESLLSWHRSWWHKCTLNILNLNFPLYKQPNFHEKCWTHLLRAQKMTLIICNKELLDLSVTWDFTTNLSREWWTWDDGSDPWPAP